MSKSLSGPIPGQSLTDEPRGFPWERPPETADPKEALMLHMENMSKPKFSDAVVYMLQLEIPVEVITNTSITMAVGNGVHSVDVGLIIAPAVHQEIVSIAEDSGIEYDEYFPEDADEEAAAKERIKSIVLSKLGKDEPKPIVSQTIEAMGSPETEEFEDMREEQEEQGDMPEGMPEQPPEEPKMSMGLMSKGL